MNIEYISDCFIKPQYAVEEAKQPIYLSPWDLALLSRNYIQKGLLFVKPSPEEHQENLVKPVLERLKESLSLALVHYYPLAGRLATSKQENPPFYSVYVDCNNSPGARFISAAVKLTVSDIVSSIDVPLVVQSFFDHDRAVNHDGHIMSLLSIQVTELLDGVFIGCSINHVVADGTSFWDFFKQFSDIFNNNKIYQFPIHKRWFPDGVGPVLDLPFTHHDQFISRHESPPLRERIFHFSSESIAKLKAKANTESKTTQISSLQALSALVWRGITRVRNLPYHQKTSCKLSINNRSRLDPPLSQYYFGNSIQTVSGTTTAGELLERGLGWAARLLHEPVVKHCDKAVRDWVSAWVESPMIYQLGLLFDPCSVMIGGSPRFETFGNEFGMGRAVAVRSGYANKFDGKVTLYPGYEGGGSMDLEVCLFPESMRALESDGEFMGGVTV